LKQIARTGVFPVGQNNETFLALHFAGGSSDGQRLGFNDRGEVAFLGMLAGDRSAIYVSDAAARSPGDFNGDGASDGADFLAWQRNVGHASDALPQDGDADGDRDVDLADLAIWKAKFGGAGATAAAIAVPEPASAALLSLIVGLLAVRNPGAASTQRCRRERG
jgi:hypothetical protein